LVGTPRDPRTHAIALNLNTSFPLLSSYHIKLSPKNIENQKKKKKKKKKKKQKPKKKDKKHTNTNT